MENNMFIVDAERWIYIGVILSLKKKFTLIGP